MKTLLFIFRKIFADKGFFAFFLMLLLLVGCGIQEDDPVPAAERFTTTPSDASARIIDIPEVVELEGYTTFYIYAEKEKREIINVQAWCEATLTNDAGKKYILITEEYMPGATTPFRILTWNVKMTPSGVLDFVWPDANDIAILEMITGYSLSGPGVNKGSEEYHGKFDGEIFQATVHMMGLQEELGIIPPYSEEIVDGPIMLKFGLDLTVVEN